jgi:hypothetical protein
VVAMMVNMVDQLVFWKIKYLLLPGFEEAENQLMWIRVTHVLQLGLFVT